MVISHRIGSGAATALSARCINSGWHFATWKHFCECRITCANGRSIRSISYFSKPPQVDGCSTRSARKESRASTRSTRSSPGPWWPRASGQPASSPASTTPKAATTTAACESAIPIAPSSSGPGARWASSAFAALLNRSREHLRFFHSVDPAIVRKRDIAGQAVKSEARLGVVEIEPLGKAMRLYDITTETEDFIANGVVSHNCYARPSHAYLELSPGLDFETKLFAKTNAAELLRAELSKPGYAPSPIAIGANTDCYQPIERKFRITRQILEILAECEHPFTMVTKSALVERDLDLLAPMASKNLVKVFVSIASLDRALARKLEPRAASPQRRMDVLRNLAQAGVPCGVMVAALIPGLNDKTLEEVLEAAAAAGAAEAAYVIMRLPNELKELFKEWLAAHYPERAGHVISIVRQMRGGRDNDPRFGSRMTGTGLFAELIEKRFEIACRRFGLNGHGAGRKPPSLDCSRFRPPCAAGQMQLF